MPPSSGEASTRIGELWFRDGRSWYVDVVVRGERVRCSLKTKDRQLARTKARQLIAELERRGPIALQVDRATVAQALGVAQQDARNNGRKSVWKTEKNVERLRAVLGDVKLASLTGAHIIAYIDQRKAAGFANGSVNRELSTLRRGLLLAIENNLVSHIPRIRLLKEAPPRSGFIEEGQYAALLQHLPEYVRPLITTAYITGWRI